MKSDSSPSSAKRKHGKPPTKRFAAHEERFSDSKKSKLEDTDRLKSPGESKIPAIMNSPVRRSSRTITPNKMLSGFIISDKIIKKEPRDGEQANNHSKNLQTTHGKTVHGSGKEKIVKAASRDENKTLLESHLTEGSAKLTKDNLAEDENDAQSLMALKDVSADETCSTKSPEENEVILDANKAQLEQQITIINKSVHDKTHVESNAVKVCVTDPPPSDLNTVKLRDKQHLNPTTHQDETLIKSNVVNPCVNEPSSPDMSTQEIPVQLDEKHPISSVQEVISTESVIGELKQEETVKGNAREIIVVFEDENGATYQMVSDDIDLNVSEEVLSSLTRCPTTENDKSNELSVAVEEVQSVPDRSFEAEEMVQGDQGNATAHETIESIPSANPKEDLAKMSSAEINALFLRDDLYVCNLCDYKAKLFGMFVRHRAAHNNGDYFYCPHCNEKFLFRRRFKAHLQVHNRIACNICGKSYTRINDRNRHIELSHSDKKPIHKCEDCSFTTGYRFMLKEHRRKHTGEFYHCTECDFKTVYQRGLKSHMAMHKKDLQLKCSKCSYCATSKATLQRHLRIHDQKKIYQCYQCSYRAVDPSYVKTHMKVHDSQPPSMYYCDQCQYKTVRSSAMRVHAMMHIGLKPWKCALCEYSTITRDKVVRHCKHKHPGNKQVNPIQTKLVKFNSSVFRYGTNDKFPYPYIIMDKGNAGEAEVLQCEEGLVLDTEVQNHEDLLIPSTDVNDAFTSDSNGGNTIYQCAFCQYQHVTEEGVHEHMYSEHADETDAVHAEENEILDEEITAMEEVEGNEVHHIVMQRNKEGQEVLVQNDVDLEIPLNDEERLGEVSVKQEKPDHTSLKVETSGPSSEVSGIKKDWRQSVALQDDAVSTAVESILHLQDATH